MFDSPASFQIFWRTLRKTKTREKGPSDYTTSAMQSRHAVLSCACLAAASLFVMPAPVMSEASSLSNEAGSRRLSMGSMSEALPHSHGQLHPSADSPLALRKVAREIPGEEKALKEGRALKLAVDRQPSFDGMGCAWIPIPVRRKDSSGASAK